MNLLDFSIFLGYNCVKDEHYNRQAISKTVKVVKNVILAVFLSKFLELWTFGK